MTFQPSLISLWTRQDRNKSTMLAIPRAPFLVCWERLKSAHLVIFNCKPHKHSLKITSFIEMTFCQYLQTFRLAKKWIHLLQWFNLLTDSHVCCCLAQSIAAYPGWVPPCKPLTPLLKWCDYRHGWLHLANLQNNR